MITEANVRSLDLANGGGGFGRPSQGAPPVFRPVGNYEAGRAPLFAEASAIATTLEPRLPVGSTRVVPALRPLIAAPPVSGSDHLRHAPSRGRWACPTFLGRVVRVVPTSRLYGCWNSCTWSADGTFEISIEIRAVCTRYLGCVSEAVDFSSFVQYMRVG